MASPVTIWTAQTSDGEPAGITVASVLVAEGELPSVLGLIDPLSDFWEAAAGSKRFIVHVVPEGHEWAASQLAGRSPVALDRFDGLNVSPSLWGPVLDSLTTRAYCSLTGVIEAGDSLLLQGSIDGIDLPEAPPDPLVYVRGAYLGVRPLNRPTRRSG